MISLISRKLKKQFTSEANTLDEVVLTKSQQEGSLTKMTTFQENMLANIRRMSEERAEDVMIPRVDIIAADAEAPLDEIIEVFREASLTRLPVYQGTLDNPIGFLHFKDLALYYGFADEEERHAFHLKDHVRRMLYIPPSMPTEILLRRMQSMRVHMALVIDEFGGVDGLVTIEDLVERVVGDIEDEHDDTDAPHWEQEDDSIYLCDSRTPIEDFERETGHTLRSIDWEDEVDTLGGLVFTMCGRVPERNEVIVHEAGHEFEIIDADPRRIKKIRLTLKDAVKSTLDDETATINDDEEKQTA